MKFNLVFLIFLTCGCSWFQKPQIRFQIVDEQNQPLHNAKIYSKAWGEVLTDEKGQVSIEDPFANTPKILIKVSHDRIPILRSQTLWVEGPKPWYKNQTIQFKVSLKPLGSSKVLKKDVEISQSQEKNELLEDIAVVKEKEFIEEVIDIPLAEPVLNRPLVAEEKKVTIEKVQLEDSKTIEPKLKELFLKYQQTPLAQARISLTQSISLTFAPLGLSDPQGMLKFVCEGNCEQEILVIEHPKCQTKLISLNHLKSTGDLFLELEQEKNLSFQNMFDAYYLPRSLENVEFLDRGAKVDVSPRSGFIVSNIQTKNLESHKLSLSYPRAVKSFVDVSSEILPRGSQGHFTVYWDPKMIVKPGVGLLDPDAESTDKNFRRFRREFLSLFTRTTTLRPVTQHDLSNKVKSIPLGLTLESLTKGWSQYSKLDYLDFLLVLKQNQIPTLELYNRFGEHLKSFSNFDPNVEAEKIARQWFEGFLQNFPWEAYGEKATDQKLKLYIGSNHAIKVGDHFSVLTTSNLQLPPRKMSAVGKVVEVKEDTLSLQIIYGSLKPDTKLYLGRRIVLDDPKIMSKMKTQIVEASKMKE